MTETELRRLAKRTPISARIVSDGSRSYFVEILGSDTIQVLQSKSGHPRHFQNLAQARELLTKARVHNVTLAMRIAAAEVCAGPAPEYAGFAYLPLSDQLE